MRVPLEVDDQAAAPPEHGGNRHRDLHPTVLPAPMQHVEDERPLAEVDVSCPGFDANPLSPGVLEVPLPAPQPVVPAVDGAASCREHRVQLDARIAVGDYGVYLSRVECLDPAAQELDVLVRHTRSPRRVPHSHRSSARGPGSATPSWLDPLQRVL